MSNNNNPDQNLSLKKKRILYVCHDGDLFGSQQSLAQVIEHLPDNVEAFLTLAKAGPLEERLAGKATIGHHKRVGWFKHSPRNVFQWLGDVMSLFVTAWPRAQTLATYMRQEHIDVVHTNSVVSLEGALAACLAGVPHVWHVRELFAERNPKLNATLGIALTARVIAALSQKIVCISQAVAQPFMLWAQDKVTIVYNAVPNIEKPCINESFRPMSRSNTNSLSLGFVGRITPNKRLQDVIDALALLKKQGIEQELSAFPVLHVFGKFVDADFERAVWQRIEDAGLVKQIVFHGFEANVGKIYDTFDIFVMPSLNEAFGRVVIEAMSAGKLCIGTDSGGVPEILTHGKTGFLVPSCDAEALAACLKQVLSLPECDAVQMIQTAKEDVNNRFGMSAQMASLMAVYDRV